MANEVFCIYHANCADGLASALSVKLYAEKNEKEFTALPAHYGDDVPDVTEREVYIVDFSYPREVLKGMKKQATSLLVIDHHKTAQKDLEGLDYCIFDMEKSGCVLTWKHFFPKEDVPLFFRYIQDRDLWKFEMDGSKEINAYIRSVKFDLEEFKTMYEYLEGFDSGAFNNIYNQGSGILRDQQKRVDSVKEAKEKGKIPRENIGGYEVLCMNCTDLVSEKCGEMAKGELFAACYFDTADSRVFSLRSDKESEKSLDVSTIAKMYGGGGHKHAAGFTLRKPPAILPR